MPFIHFDLSFGFLKGFWSFSKLMRFLPNFWVGLGFAKMIMYAHALHQICIFIVVHAF